MADGSGYQTINLGLARLTADKPWLTDRVLRDLIDTLDTMFVASDGIVLGYDSSNKTVGFGVPFISLMYHRNRPILDDLDEVAGGATSTATDGERGINLSIPAASEHFAAWVVDRGDGGAASSAIGVHRGTTETMVGPCLKAAGTTFYTFHIEDDGDAVITKWSDPETIDGTPEVVAAGILPAGADQAELILSAVGDDLIGRISFDGDTHYDLVTLAGETGVEAAITQVGFFIRKDSGAVGLAGVYHFIQ